MLGAQSGVTDSNMIQYLGIIEQRTNELLAVQSYVNSKVNVFNRTSNHFMYPFSMRDINGIARKFDNKSVNFIIYFYFVSSNFLHVLINEQYIYFHSVYLSSTLFYWGITIIAISCQCTQDQDRYDAKQPVLLGAGPAPSQSQYPVIPPTIGYVFPSVCASLFYFSLTSPGHGPACTRAPHHTLTHQPFICVIILSHVWHFQDEDRYPQKPPSLLGGGPGAPNQQWPIHPPGFGYLWPNYRQI